MFFKHLLKKYRDKILKIKMFQLKFIHLERNILHKFDFKNN